jgi:ABC-type glycerol-3-phosphate transport system substrate-binding protein
MNRILKLCAGLLTAMALTGAHAAAEIKLDGYHTYPAHKVWQDELAKRYMEKHPEITITYRAPAPTYDDALLAIARQALTNQQPDFHLWRADWCNLLMIYCKAKIWPPLAIPRKYWRKARLTASNMPCLGAFQPRSFL